MVDTERKCGNCDHAGISRHNQQQILVCRRYPPQLVTRYSRDPEATPQLVTRWPNIQSESRCGEFMVRADDAESLEGIQE